MGHLQIQQQNVGGGSQHLFLDGPAVCEFRHDLNAGFVIEQGMYPGPKQDVVVGNRDANRRGGGALMHSPLIGQEKPSRGYSTQARGRSNPRAMLEI
jgi:hypothetical protein